MDSISFVVTVFNKEKFLPDVLDCILKDRRHCGGGEIVLVNDGSTDRSLALLEAFASANEGVIVVDQPNGGVAKASNVGFAHATCPFVRFVDGDDLIVLGSSRALVDVLKAQDAAIAYGSYAEYDSHAPFAVPVFPQDAAFHRLQDPLRAVLRHCPFSPSSTVLNRKRVQAAFPLPETFRTGQDFSMGLRFATCGLFVETDVPCSFGPSAAQGRLSSNKALMYYEDVLIFAGEFQSNPGRFSRQDAAYAVGRMAGRAINYARRHLRCSSRQMIALWWIKVKLRFPYARASVRDMQTIAATYRSAS